MVDNVNPLIGAEEEKSEKEPHKIWEVKTGDYRYVYPCSGE
jgi:hypothetical protein